MRKLMIGLAAAAMLAACGPENNGENNGNNGETNNDTSNADTNNDTSNSDTNNDTSNSDTNNDTTSTNNDTTSTNNGTTAGTNNGTTNGTNNGTTAGDSAMCVAYCEQVQANCTGGDELFADEAECLTACADYADNGTDCSDDPNACSGEGEGVQCRLYHGWFAGADQSDDPGTHCPHASEDGGGVCG